MKPEHTCVNHPGAEIVSFCHHCYDRLCKDCVTEGPEHYYCRKPECLKALESEKIFATQEKSEKLNTITRKTKPKIRTYGYSFIWTVILLAIYLGLYYIPLPTIGFANQLPQSKGTNLSEFNILSMGWMPVVSGFIWVEIISLFLKPFRGWRLAGITGREKLNQCAWGLSFLFALFQSFGTNHLVLEIMHENIPSFSPPNPLLFQVLNIVSLMGGTFLCVWIARLITQIGVGNGFLIIFLYGWIKSVLNNILLSFNDFRKLNPTSNELFRFFMLIILMLIALVFLWKFIQKGPRIPVKMANGKRLWFEISPLPMSVGVYIWSLSIISICTIFLIYFRAYGDERLSNLISMMKDGWLHIVLLCILLALFSWVFYNLFYSEIDVFGIGIENLPGRLRKREMILDHQFWKALAVLLAGTILFKLPICFNTGSDMRMGDLIFFVQAFVVIQDILAQMKFCRIHGQGVELLELDNVHLASYLKGLFQVEKIPCHIQAYGYRRLMFMFSPLYKMRLLVPEEEIDRSKVLLSTIDFKVV